jgi:hypothetical protein
MNTRNLRAKYPPGGGGGYPSKVNVERKKKNDVTATKALSEERALSRQTS